ncbi:Ankyrin-1 [Holothuria leucospilota]|uniref:Ankyrin-1 n=1 Tax=Holothuria leucospilota TaxID=206669 RepID=A0A9Q1BUS3_HOLLE|nr:Ankyrin-1 [Holothuria leucospilota]
MSDKDVARERTSDKADTISLASSHATISTAGSSNINGSKLLFLSVKGEWTGVETYLRGLEKGDPEISVASEETGMTPLLYAVKDNKLVVAERLLQLGANINYKCKDGRAAIHFAASSAREDLLKLLILKKADAAQPGGPLNQLPLHMVSSRTSGALSLIQQLLRVSPKDAKLIKDSEGSIPLFCSIEAGNLAVCKDLLLTHKEEQVRTIKDSNKDTALHIACRKGEGDIVKLLVDSGALVDVQNDDGHTPLHITAWLGDVNTLKYLYQVKANPDICDRLDRSPLHIAAELGHTEVVEMLVDRFKASVAARTKDGSTLMHIASQCGHPDTALAFLKKGVPLHMPNKAGAVCLHAAAKRGHTAVVRALLQKGAQVDARTKDNYSALHIAVQYCKPLVVQTLLGYGAQVQLKGGKAEETPLHIAARVKEGEKVAEMLLKSGADVNATMSNGETAMHVAARHGHLKMVQALLEEGADVECSSKVGENPLHVAVRHAHFVIVNELITFLDNELSRLDAVMAVNSQSEEGETPLHYAAEVTKNMIHHPKEDLDIMAKLLEYDADINVITKLTHETPLHYCARAGNTDILLQMLKHLGPNKSQLAVNRQSKNGWSPLLLASEEGHVDTVKQLLQYNARVDVFDEHGKAALHLAAERGHREVALILLSSKAFVNAKSKLGVTPVHLSAQNGHNELLQALVLNHGASVDALSVAKQTPLHLAAQYGQLKVCETLLNMRGDAYATDIHGQTPLHLAAENDHAEIVKLFLKYKPELVTMANADGSTCAHIAASKGSVAVIKELLRFNRSGVCSARNKKKDSTALHLASAGGHTEVVSVLLEAGASPTEETSDGLTAIHLAAKEGHVGVLEVLKGKVPWHAPSVKSGLTALHIAAHTGQIDFVREMLPSVPATIRSEISAGVALGDDYGLTPLHLAAQSGHEGLVRLLLNSPGVQPDVPTVMQGTIPLHLAARSGYTAVVGLLLSKSTTQLHVKDKRGRTGLHLAAANGHYDMVSLLLGQGSDINASDRNGWSALHFAAKAGFLNVVKLLVESGASPKIETKDGKLPICYSASTNHHEVLSYLMKQDYNVHQLMEDKKFVFDLMVCGKYYNQAPIQEFILRSPAPVETAVKLSRNFKLQSTREKERAKDLLEAADFCGGMAVDLISIVGSSNGAGPLLRSENSQGVKFLDVLIEFEQKDAVAHPAVQRYLTDLWMGNLNWANWKILLFFLLMVCPPVWIVFSLPLKHRYHKLPIIKFMSVLVSHFYLICLLIMTTVVTSFIESFIASPSLIPKWYEWLLLLWLTGLLVAEISNPGDRSGLGWIRVLILALSSIACTLHVIAIFFDQDIQRLLVYIRNQFLAWCLLLCFVHFLEFLSFHHLFGPWAIIIRDLMKDLVRFMVILLIFLIGFMLHLAAVYQPVYPMDSINTSNDTIQSPADTFEILFFSLFGLVEPDNLPSITRHPDFTLILVKVVFGAYLVITLIILINLLIAMMSDTYQRIQAQSDVEWKFGRAKLIRKMNRTSATPSPLNLLTKIFLYCKAAYRYKGKLCTPQARSFISEEEELDTLADSMSVDFTNNTGWLRVMARRNTQIHPDGGFLRMNQSGPQRIETVMDWHSITLRYLSIKGVDDSEWRQQDDKDVMTSGAEENSHNAQGLTHRKNHVGSTNHVGGNGSRKFSNR